MKKNKKLLDAYTFPGFRPQAVVKGKFGDNKARIIRLVRRQKKLFAVVAERSIRLFMTGKLSWLEICPAVMPESIYPWKCDELTV